MIRDQTFELAAAEVHALEQPLRDLHRPLGREPELAAGFLLQRRGGERRRRPLRARLLLDARDRPRQSPHQRLAQAPCASGLVEQPRRVVRFELRPLRVEVLAGGDALVADPRERGGELAAVAAQLRLEIPVARGAEREALFFALDDQRAPPRSARGPRSGRSAPSSTAPATACSRRADRGCAGSPARAPGSRRRRARRRAPRLTASSVISWKTMRRTGTFGLSSSFRCQLIDSPSRSGSVASISSEASFIAAFSAATCFFLSAGTT